MANDFKPRARTRRRRAGEETLSAKVLTENLDAIARVDERQPPPYIAGENHTKYDPERYPEMARVACAELGARTEDLAKLFNVTENCVIDWQRKYKEFGEAVTIGRDQFTVDKVQRALYKRATGYDVVEVTQKGRMVPVFGADGEVVINPDTGQPVMEFSPVTQERKVKHILPDPLSCFFVLTNRDQKRWQHSRKLISEVTGETKHTEERSLKLDDPRLNLEALSVTELEQLHTLLAKAERQGEDEARRIAVEQESRDEHGVSVSDLKEQMGVTRKREGEGTEDPSRKKSGAFH